MSAFLSDLSRLVLSDVRVCSRTGFRRCELVPLVTRGGVWVALAARGDEIGVVVPRRANGTDA